MRSVTTIVACITLDATRTLSSLPRCWDGDSIALALLRFYRACLHASSYTIAVVAYSVTEYVTTAVVYPGVTRVLLNQNQNQSENSLVVCTMLWVHGPLIDEHCVAVHTL